MFLLCRHIYAEDLLHLSRQRFFYIFLDASEKERLEDFVQTLITVFPSFPMFIFKILPRIKPKQKILFSSPSILNRCNFHCFCSESYSKVLTGTYLSGMRKCNSDHSSLREFCRGVPVMRSLWLDLNSINDLYSRESSFFSRCASSTPRNAQLMFPSTPWRQMLQLILFVH